MLTPTDSEFQRILTTHTEHVRQVRRLRPRARVGLLCVRARVRACARARAGVRARACAGRARVLAPYACGRLGVCGCECVCM